MSTGLSADLLASQTVIINHLKALLHAALIDFDSSLAYKFALCLRVIPSKLPIRGTAIYSTFTEAFKDPDFLDSLQCSPLIIPNIGHLWILVFLDHPDLQYYASKLTNSQIEEFVHEPSLRHVTFTLQSNSIDNRQLLDDAVRLAGFDAYPFFYYHCPELHFPEDDWIAGGFLFVDDLWSLLATSSRTTTLITLLTSIGYPCLGPRIWHPRATLAQAFLNASLDPVKEAQFYHILASIYQRPTIQATHILKLDADCRAAGLHLLPSPPRLLLDTSDMDVVGELERFPPILHYVFANLTHLLTRTPPLAPLPSIPIPPSILLLPKRPLPSSALLPHPQPTILPPPSTPTPTTTTSSTPLVDALTLARSLLTPLSLAYLRLTAIHFKVKAAKKSQTRLSYITSLMALLTTADKAAALTHYVLQLADNVTPSHRAPPPVPQPPLVSLLESRTHDVLESLRLLPLHHLRMIHSSIGLPLDTDDADLLHSITDSILDSGDIDRITTLLSPSLLQPPPPPILQASPSLPASKRHPPSSPTSDTADEFELLIAHSTKKLKSSVSLPSSPTPIVRPPNELILLQHLERLSIEAAAARADQHRINTMLITSLAGIQRSLRPMPSPRPRTPSPPSPPPPPVASSLPLATPPHPSIPILDTFAPFIFQGVATTAINTSAAYYIVCTNPFGCTCDAHPLDDQDLLWYCALSRQLITALGEYVLYYEGPIDPSNPRYTVRNVSCASSSKAIYRVSTLTPTSASLTLVHGSTRSSNSAPWPSVIRGLPLGQPLLLLHGVLRDQFEELSADTPPASGIPPPPSVPAAPSLQPSAALPSISTTLTNAPPGTFVTLQLPPPHINTDGYAFPGVVDKDTKSHIHNHLRTFCRLVDNPHTVYAVTKNYSLNLATDLLPNILEYTHAFTSCTLVSSDYSFSSLPCIGMIRSMTACPILKSTVKFAAFFQGEFSSETTHPTRPVLGDFCSHPITTVAHHYGPAYIAPIREAITNISLLLQSFSQMGVWTGVFDFPLRLTDPNMHPGESLVEFHDRTMLAAVLFRICFAMEFSRLFHMVAHAPTESFPDLSRSIGAVALRFKQSLDTIQLIPRHLEQVYKLHISDPLKPHVDVGRSPPPKPLATPPKSHNKAPSSTPKVNPPPPPLTSKSTIPTSAAPCRAHLFHYIGYSDKSGIPLKPCLHQPCAYRHHNYTKMSTGAFERTVAAAGVKPPTTTKCLTLFTALPIVAGHKCVE